MEAFHKTGKGMTPAEVDDFLEFDIKSKDRTNFVTYPNCIPRKATDICGMKDRWEVRLHPSVISGQIQSTIDALLAKYPGALFNNSYWLTMSDKGIADRIIGASFYIDAPESIAKQISEDEVVRYVEQYRMGISSMDIARIL